MKGCRCSDDATTYDGYIALPGHHWQGSLIIVASETPEAIMILDLSTEIPSARKEQFEETLREWDLQSQMFQLHTYIRYTYTTNV